MSKAGDFPFQIFFKQRNRHKQNEKTNKQTYPVISSRFVANQYILQSDWLRGFALKNWELKCLETYFSFHSVLFSAGLKLSGRTFHATIGKLSYAWQHLWNKFVYIFSSSDCL